MRQWTHGSLFAGIEGFGLGFRNAGFRTLWAVEKEPFCQAVIRTHFPETEIHSDVHDVGKHNLTAVDVLTAGFPCQDLSVAGKRAGLGGARSGLFWQAHRIIGELQPPWFVIENVPGLFSSNSGRDFAVLLRGLDELGYGLAWRVLDSQFFGVAQRRRRVFIVGCFGKPCPETVLFESEGGEGDFTESGETWERVAGEVGDSIVGTLKFSAKGGACRLDAEQSADGFLQLAAPLTHGSGITGSAPGRRREDDINLAIRPTIEASDGRKWGSNQWVNNGKAVLATALSASNGHHGHSSPRGDGSDNLIAIQDVRGHRDKKQNGIGIDASGGAMYTLDGTSQHAVCGAITNFSSGGSDDNDGRNGFLHVSTAPDPDRMRSFTELPEGLDSARYRALGNAVTAKVANWIAERIKAALEAEARSRGTRLGS